MEKPLSRKESEKIRIVGGFAHPELTEQIAQSIGVEAGGVTEKIHPNSELYVRFEDSVRGRQVFVVQSHIRNSKMGT